jgi:rare lipoprotein A
MRRARAALAALVVTAGCAARREAVRAPAAQEGIASWYGPGLHGGRTADGQRFDQQEFTAAHPSLPLGSRVRVTHLASGRSVDVRITDRGPFARGRVIDLSRGAARALGMVESGTARVRVQPVGTSLRAAPRRDSRAHRRRSRRARSARP